MHLQAVAKKCGIYENKSSMDVKEQRRVIDEDLYNELRYLLISASLWKVCRELERAKDIDRLAQFPHHLQAIAMDSACVHARALYEFFFNSRDPETASAQRHFGVTLVETPRYLKYEHTLNKRLFHIDLDRPQPKERHGTVSVSRNLNRQPKAFADDILAVWGRFTRQAPADVRLQLKAAREKVIAEGTRAAASLGAAPIFR